jgi:hypothetical protein
VFPSISATSIFSELLSNKVYTTSVQPASAACSRGVRLLLSTTVYCSSAMSIFKPPLIILIFMDVRVLSLQLCLMPSISNSNFKPTKYPKINNYLDLNV